MCAKEELAHFYTLRTLKRLIMHKNVELLDNTVKKMGYTAYKLNTKRTKSKNA